MKFEERLIEMKDRCRKEDKERREKNIKDEKSGIFKFEFNMLPLPHFQYSIRFNYNCHNSSREISDWPDADMS